MPVKGCTLPLRFRGAVRLGVAECAGDTTDEYIYCVQKVVSPFVSRCMEL